MSPRSLFATEVLRLGPLSITDTLLWSLAISLWLTVTLWALVRSRRARPVLEMIYETLEQSIVSTTTADVRPLVPLVLTLWAFILTANLIGLVPAVGSPTRDLSVTSALALVAFLSGHYYAFRAHGLGYLRGYLQPHALLLPFNVVGELSRTVALSLRLFGNMVSGQLIAAILVYLAGLLVPVPLMLLSVLTSVVQAYIFGVLTLVFAASSIEAAHATARRAERRERTSPS